MFEKFKRKEEGVLDKLEGDRESYINRLKTIFGTYKPEKMTDKEKEENRANIAASFQQAVTDILVLKTIRAAREYNANTVMLAGGVAANKYLRSSLEKELKKTLGHAKFIVPEIKLATDNGVMIAIAAYLRYKNGDISNWKSLEANSNKLITEN